MKQLFIASDAFVALNDTQDPNHKRASDFVVSLFNKTVKLYSSIVEIVCAAEALSATYDKTRAHRFIELVLRDSGIVILPADITERINGKARTKLNNSYKDLLMTQVMRSNGIKDVFSFKESLRDLNVVVWPKR